MARFAVVIGHRVLEFLDVTVEAETAAEAKQHVQEVIDKCGSEIGTRWDTIRESFSDEYQAWLDIEEEDIAVEHAEQLDPVSHE